MEKYTNFKQRSNLNNKGIIKTCFNILEEKVRKYIFIIKALCVNIVKMRYILLENSDFKPDHNSGRN